MISQKQPLALKFQANPRAASFGEDSWVIGDSRGSSPACNFSKLTRDRRLRSVLM